MIPIPPDAPLAVRLGARLGPEIVASLLVVAVVLVGVAVALSGRQATGSLASPQPSDGTASTLTPSIAPTPSPNRAAQALVDVVDRLLLERADLLAEAAKNRTDVEAIADVLREVNTSLVLVDGPLVELAADPETADLASRIRTVKEATFDAVRRTQRASITNADAYRAGAADVAGALAPLAEIRAELATLAGEVPASKAAPSQPVVTTAPSGTTP